MKNIDNKTIAIMIFISAALIYLPIPFGNSIAVVLNIVAGIFLLLK